MRTSKNFARASENPAALPYQLCFNQNVYSYSLLSERLNGKLPSVGCLIAHTVKDREGSREKDKEREGEKEEERRTRER